ncbi:TetR family transcriptional regulator [Lentzea guizhouensis]|uniref:TetR family transcriptional regulator n=1 Tax=Lentzea guizhouensis TaxID=1586287 RepID=A0A1B2HB35_9PSEU|nr:TetR/AcrR family transcriptional regulator [Lentzea guizhouensis]ANZ34934.1 TetR family transcriptional regulator [Lentzea guizhouensis]
MPTGVHLRDVREQLFDAAERVLTGGGPSALTSRAVTETAGVAKGVLHRHFADFDAFLAEFVLDRATRTEARLKELTAGDGDVVGNLTEAITAVFSSVAVAVVALLTFRDELRARLRDTWPAGVPVLTEAVELIAAYLEAEQRHGRVRSGVDVEGLAPMLVGSAHLLFADRQARPDADAVRRMVRQVVDPSLSN